MSGELGFLLLLPVVLPAVAGAATVKAVGEAGEAAAKAVSQYERRRQEERDLIRQSGVKDEMSGFRKSVRDLVKEQRQKNRDLSAEFEASLEHSRQDLQAQAGSLGEQREAFLADAQDAAKRMLRQMERQQRQLQGEYREKIRQEMADFEEEEQERLEKVMDGLTELAEGEEKQRHMLRAEAEHRLTESEELLDELEKQFQGEKYAGSEQMEVHRVAYRDAKRLFDEGNYEACLTAAVSLATRLRSDILAADEKRMEFETWQKTALMMVEENLAFLEANETLTEETYQLLSQGYEAEGEELALSEDWIGQSMYPFWGRTEDGEFYYEATVRQLQQLRDRIQSADCPLSVEDLEKAAEMSSTLRPQLISQLTTVYERLLNAWQREQMSSQIIERMGEMDYTYEDYTYVRHTREGDVPAREEDVDANLCMVFTDRAGDEILVELSNHNRGIRLEVTDMVEEQNPEIDRTAYRRSLEDSIREIVYDAEENGVAEHVTGGCTRPGQEIVATPESRRKLQLVKQTEDE